MVGQQRQEPLAFTTAVMGDVTNQVVRMAASQVEVPAPPPEVKDRNDISEAFLGRLDGSTFVAPDTAGAEISRRIDRWAAPVVGTKNPKLIVSLSPPDDSNAWLALVLGTSSSGSLDRVQIERSTRIGSRDFTFFRFSWVAGMRVANRSRVRAAIPQRSKGCVNRFTAGLRKPSETEMGSPRDQMAPSPIRRSGSVHSSMTSC